MSILPKGFSLFLKTLTVLSDQKNRLALRVAGQFFFNYSRANKRVEERSTSEVVSYLAQPNVNIEEYRLRQNFAAIWPTK